MSGKRKRDDDSSDEEVTAGYQVLPVANLPEDFDGEPVDGMQYLFTVRRNARQLPMVTRVVNPYEQPHQQTPPPNSDMPQPHSEMPNEQWRLSYQKHYSNFRKNFVQSTSSNHFNVQDPRQKCMPEKKERDLWWAFLAGRPEVDWTKKPKESNANARYGRGMRGFVPENNLPYEASFNGTDEGEVERALALDPSESLPTPSGSPAPQEEPSTPSTSNGVLPLAYTPREPTPFLMRQIDHRTALHLLMYFTHWVNLYVQQDQPPSLANSYLTEAHARWIFSLLARVEDFVAADDMSLLRNLARACLALLKKNIKARGTTLGRKEEAFGERSCWIIVSTVVGVWAQRDLWMEAEDMLGQL